RRAPARRGRGRGMEQVAALVALTLAAGAPPRFAPPGGPGPPKTRGPHLGVEGKELVGAVGAVLRAGAAQSARRGVVSGRAAGRAALSLVFGVLTLSLMANQVVSGLALSLFGVGLSAFVGKGWVSLVIEGIQPLAIPGLSDLPFLGKLLFAYNPLVYLSLVL